MKALPKTDIEYLTHHWPVVTGCSFGCPWCWAKAAALRFPAVHKYPDGILAEFKKPQLHPDRLDLPLRRKKPARIGVCFTGDLFGPEIDEVARFRILGTMQSAPQHQFFLLTKRAADMKEDIERFQNKWLDCASGSWVREYHHVFLGVTVATQAEADERIPLLLATPAAKRWVSIEPMLGPVDLGAFTGLTFGPDFVVVGSIDRPSAQFPAPRREWIDSIVDQCRAAGVPVWVKNNAQHLARRDAIRPGTWPQELPS